MSATQDIVVARLRTVAARWWGGRPRAGSDATSSSAAGGQPVPDGADRPAPPAQDATETGGDLPDEAAVAGGAVAQGTELPALDSGSRGARSQVLLALGALACVAALVVAGGAVAGGWPRVGPQPAPAPTSPVGLFPLEIGAASPSTSPSVVVHVVGEVRDPGVVTLPAGARVADAVRAAGGLRRGGRLGATNLARVLADGERVEIGGQDGGAMPPDGPGAGGAVAPVNLNTATAQQLDALPGIGPVTAAKILAWRAEHGRFSVVDELAEVPGIGPRTLEELRPHVRV